MPALFANRGMKFLNFLILFIAVIFNNKLLGKTTPLIVLPLQGSTRISIAPKETLYIQKKNFLQIKDDKSSIQLRGKTCGATTIQVGAKAYKVVVINDDDYKNFQRLQAFLLHTPTMFIDDFNDSNNQWVLNGRLDHASTWMSLALQNFNSFQSHFETTSEQLKMIEYDLNKKLKQESLYPITLRFEPTPTVRLPPTHIKNIRIHEILKSYGIVIKEDSQQLTAEPLVRVHVLLIELRKSAAQSLGVEWPTDVTIKALPKNALPLDGGPSALLHFLSTQGQGKVLANPILLTKSGSEADFFAGGEFPVRIKTHQTYSISWKKYGIGLKIKPLADGDGKISLDLTSEISSIDSGQSLDGIPALFTNSLSSHFDLQNAQMIALSGLTKKVNGEAIKEWPGLSSIPLLGALFSSKEYLEDQTELVVFVSPVIVPPGD